MYYKKKDEQSHDTGINYGKTLFGCEKKYITDPIHTWQNSKK